MKNRTFSIIILIMLCFLAACNPSESTIQTAIAETAIAQPLPTDTLEPTEPPTSTIEPSDTPTFTPIPSDTPTLTPTPSLTPSKTPTRTPLPTLTATPTPNTPLIDIGLTGPFYRGPSDKYATYGLVTNSSIGWYVTVNENGQWYFVELEDGTTGWLPADRLDNAGPEIAAALPVSTSAPTPTNTPLPTNTPDPRNEYMTIDIRELDSYAEDHIGEKVRLRGRVFNIAVSGTSGALQMWVNNVAVFVVFPSSILPDEVYEDTWITVYGTVQGFFTGENAFGGTIQQPQIRAQIIEK